MATKLLTYTGLLNDVHYRPADIDSREVLKLLRQAQNIPQQLLPFKGIIHVIDYTQGRHVGLSGPLKDMTGHDPRDVMNNGLSFVMDIFQKDDFKIFNEKIFVQIINTLKEAGAAEHDKLIFSFTYRMRRANGKWMHLYQQGSYITDPATKLPLYSIAMVNDISAIKKDNSMVFAIDRKPMASPPVYFENLQTNYYYPDPGESKLSKREREVLGWMAEGLGSKQIAAKLHLSEHTVALHRKNMLRKANAKSSAELIRYGIQRGLI